MFAFSALFWSQLYCLNTQTVTMLLFDICKPQFIKSVEEGAGRAGFLLIKIESLYLRIMRLK